MNERLWAESTDTAKGRAEHTRVHTQRVEKRGDLVNLYEFTVFSDSLLLLGKCDCVEARRDDSGCRIPAVDFPVGKKSDFVLNIKRRYPFAEAC